MKGWLHVVVLSFAALIAAPLLAQTASPPPVPAPKPLPRVLIHTSVGDMVVEVETVKAPITAANFLHYVDTKRLDGRAFYRVVKVAPEFGFVQFGTLGDPKTTFPPIRHEPTTKTGLHHGDGWLSVARLAPGTAAGDFTIMVGDQPSMDADPSKPGDNLGYAAFAHVIEGRDVLLKILDTPVDPKKNSQGAFRGEMPLAPVKIITARRIAIP